LEHPKAIGINSDVSGAGLKGEVFEKLLGGYEKNMHLGFLYECVTPKSSPF